MCNRKKAGLGLILVVASPLLTLPLSWLPKSWADFRYDWVLPLPEIILAVGLCVACAVLLKRTTAENIVGYPVLFSQRTGLPLLAVLASGLVSTRFSEHSHFGLELLPRLGGNVAIFLLAANASRERMSWMRNWWMAVAVIVAINGLLRLRFEPEFISTLGNKNFLGVYLAASVVIGTSLGGMWPILGNIVLLTAMALCMSRGSWLSLALVAALWFLGFGNRFLKRWPTRGVIVLLLLIGAGVLARPYVLRQWQTDVRPMIWKGTLRMMAARPMLGHGLGTYVAVYPQYRPPEYFLRPKSTNVTDHAHNELLEIAAEQGLIGLAATLWLWVTALWCGVRACRQPDEVGRRIAFGLLGATVVVMLHGMVDVDLRYLPNQSLLWLLMGLLVGADPTPARRPQIPFPSKPARWCLALACLALGICVAVVAVIRPMMGDWLDREARIAEENGDLNAAAQYAWCALSLQPFRLSTRYLLAGVLSREPGAPARDAAVEECLRIEELAPDYADTTYNLGQVYMAANRAAEALPCLRRAVEINPYSADRHVALAMALRDDSKDDEAVRELDRALQLRPNNPDARALREKIRKQGTP